MADVDVAGPMTLAPAMMTPATATLEFSPDLPPVTLSLAERQRLFRRRRQLMTLREWSGVIGIVATTLVLGSVALLSFLAH